MDKERELEIARRIGAAIAKRRIELNMTQEAVAEQLGVGFEAISRIERGIVMPTIARLMEFADVFGCTVDAILTEISTRPTDQAKQLEKVLSEMTETDRMLILELLNKFANRLMTTGR